MKKLLRVCLWLGAGLALLLVVLTLLAFTPAVQSWVARQVLPAQPLSFQRIAVGLKTIEVEGLQFTQPGQALSLPKLSVELDLLTAATGGAVHLQKLVARGWVLDLRPAPGTSTPPAPTASSSPANPAATSAAKAAPQAFVGLFHQLGLPVDLVIQSLDSTGEVILPQGRAQVSLNGGDFGVGREGALVLTSDFTPTALATGTTNTPPGTPARPIARLQTRNELRGHMDTPRTFDRLSLVSETRATGGSLPATVVLKLNLAATRATDGAESFTGSLQTGPAPLASFTLQVPRPGAALTGDWRVQLADTDLSPFALGLLLPEATLSGEGTFTSDPTFQTIGTRGQITARLAHPEDYLPALAALGPLQLQSSFDLTAALAATPAATVLRFGRLELTLQGHQPLFVLSSLQPFACTLASSAAPQLAPLDAARDWLQLRVPGLPLTYLAPWLPAGTSLSGEAFTGTLNARLQDSVLALHTAAPLRLPHLTYRQAGQNLVQDLDLAADATVQVPLSTTYVPQSWQAALTSLSLSSQGNALAQLSAKVGQASLAPKASAVVATGQYDLALPAWQRQPVLASLPPLSSGRLQGDFTAQSDTAQRLSLNLQLSELSAAAVTSTPASAVASSASAASAPAQPAPTVSLQARLDLAADGQLELRAPFTLTQAGRSSDLLLALDGQTRATPPRFTGHLTSNTLHLPDLQSLAAALTPAKPTTSASTAPTPPPAALTPSTPSTAAAVPSPAPAAAWPAVSGELKLALRNLIYSKDFSIKDVQGTLQLTPASLSLPVLKASIGPGGQLQAMGDLSFFPLQPAPYTLKGELNLTSLDVGALLQAAQPQQTPSIEGRFDVSAHLVGQAATPSGFTSSALGDIQVNSRGGALNTLGLAVSSQNQSRINQAASALGSVSSSLGDLLGNTLGNKSLGQLALKAEASTAIVQSFSRIPFDQLHLVAASIDDHTFAIKDFTLIAPQLRLLGQGALNYDPRRVWYHQPLHLQLQAGVRDRLAQSFRQLSLLGPTSDALGYTELSEPLTITGTVQSLGLGTLQRLLQRAILP